MGKTYQEKDLREAQIAFSLVSQLVYNEPEQDWLTSFIDNKAFEAAPFGMDIPSVLKGLDSLGAWSSYALQRGLKPTVDDLKSEWFTVLVGAGTPKAPCWGSFYCETNSQLFGIGTLEVRRWYKEHGLMLQRENKEPDDHLGLILGFISFLMGKEADALVRQDQKEADRLCEAQQDFMTAHLLPWLPVWRYQLSKYAYSDFYRGVADLVFGLCEAYVQRFEIHFDQEKEAFFFKNRQESVVL